LNNIIDVIRSVRMRYEPDRKQRTHEKILKAAAKAIRAQGPHRVGVAQVMGKVGLTHGGFYAHFRSKDALIAAAIGQMFEEALDTWDQYTLGKSPAESLSTYVDFYLSPAHRDSVSAGCPIPTLAPELRRLTKSCRDAFASGVAALTERIRSELERLGVEHADEEASSMLAEMVGALALARAEPNAARSDAILDASKRRIKARIAAHSVG
jgi:TetR/AcrR family transcriptional repressor of nem operon